MIKSSPVSVNLSLDVQSELLIANLSFENQSNDSVYLDSWAVFINNKIYNNFFVVVDENNHKIDYIGMLGNRPFRKENFIELGARKKINVSIVLSDVYRIIKGKKYAINYYKFHPTSLQNDGLMILQSNTVDFTY
jgi:hypothetical protein